MKCLFYLCKSINHIFTDENLIELVVERFNLAREEKMKQTFRWGIIGAGTIAHRFATAVKKLNGMELAAIASREKERSELFGKQYDVPNEKCYGSYQDLVNDEEIDAVYIATLHPFHKEQAILCLEHGKGVLCEKPVTMNKGEIEEVVRVARRHKVFFMEAMKSRFLPINIQLQKLISEGIIGEVRHMRAELGFKAEFDPEGRLYNKAKGGGALLDIGIYPVSYAAYILGNKPMTVESQLTYGVTGIDESNAIQLGYENGARAQLYSTIQVNTTKEASILGTEGRIHIPIFSNAQAATIYLDSGKEKTIAEPYEINGFEYEIREAVRCMKEGLLESPYMTWSDSIEVMGIIDQIFAASQVK